METAEAMEPERSVRTMGPSVLSTADAADGPLGRAPDDAPGLAGTDACRTREVALALPAAAALPAP